MAKNTKRLSDFTVSASEDLLDIVQRTAAEEYSAALAICAANIIKNPQLSCSLRMNDDEGAIIFMQKWTDKYLKGYKNRASKRKSSVITTQPDRIIDIIIEARIKKSGDDLNTIKYWHRLAMAAENIAGALLEEYLAEKLIAHGWYCCWGETMRSIDFCTASGLFLQIKNSDNSENSSSKQVRDGTTIKHWFRRFSRTGETNWPALNTLIGISNEMPQLTEDDFCTFVRETISNNPDSLFVEEASPFYGS